MTDPDGTMVSIWMTRGWSAADESDRDQKRQRRKQFQGVFNPASLHRLRRSEEHTSELQSRGHLVCRLLLEKKDIYAENVKKLELHNDQLEGDERERRQY